MEPDPDLPPALEPLRHVRLHLPPRRLGRLAQLLEHAARARPVPAHERAEAAELRDGGDALARAREHEEVVDGLGERVADGDGRGRVREVDVGRDGLGVGRAGVPLEGAERVGVAGGRRRRHWRRWWWWWWVGKAWAAGR